MQSYYMTVIGLVIIIIAALLIKRKRSRDYFAEHYASRTMRNSSNNSEDDGVIAVRKRERMVPTFEQPQANQAAVSAPAQPVHIAANKPQRVKASPESLLAIYVMAKNNKQFVGYELLQSLLTAGMRFGEMNIFHRYRELNGEGTLLFSLASATEPGTFDIHNMGAYSGRGLTLFMQRAANFTDDMLRYELMLKTAQQLAEDLDGILLDEKREPLTQEKIGTKKLEMSSDSR